MMGRDLITCLMAPLVGGPRQITFAAVVSVGKGQIKAFC